MHRRFGLRQSGFCIEGECDKSRKKAALPQWKAGMHPRTPKSYGSLFAAQPSVGFFVVHNDFLDRIPAQLASEPHDDFYVPRKCEGPA